MTTWRSAAAADRATAPVRCAARDLPRRRVLAAASSPPDAQAPEPVVNIVVDQATFEAAIATAVGDRSVRGMESSTPPDTTRRRCETLDGALLDPFDVVAAAAVGHVRRVVYDSASTTIDLGGGSRLFTGLARHAAWLQGTRCIWPGCGHRHCQIDHSTAWNDHGHTSPHNAAPLCGWHNRWKTRGYRTWRDPDGMWHVYRPDGTEIRAA